MKVRKNKKNGFDVCKLAIEKHLEDFTKAVEDASEGYKPYVQIYRLIDAFYNQSIGYSFACMEMNVINYDDCMELQKISLKWLIRETSDIDNGFCDYKYKHDCLKCPFLKEHDYNAEFFDVESKCSSSWCELFEEEPNQFEDEVSYDEDALQCYTHDDCFD